MVLTLGMVAGPAAAFGWPSTMEANRQADLPWADLHGAGPDGVFLVFRNPSSGPVSFEYRLDGEGPPALAAPHPNPCVIGADPLPAECAAHAYIPPGEFQYATVDVAANDAKPVPFELDERVDIRLAIGTVVGGVSTVHGWEFDWTPFPIPVPPSAPQDVTATPGDGEVTVRWAAPEDPGNYPPITYYHVGGESDEGPILWLLDGSARSAVISGLTNGTTYTFRVFASNTAPASISPPSQDVTATPGRVPGEPIEITATPGDGQATISWKAPADTGTSPITGYLVTSFPGGPIESVGPTARSATIQGLPNNETFTFRVQAGNLSGWSAKSTAVSVTPVDPIEVPSGIAVLGGPAAVSDTVLTQLHTLTGVAPTRLAGGDRYDTAAAIVADAFPGTVDTVYLATGTNFPDALAGSASAAAKNAPVLLVTPDDIPPATATQLQRLSPTHVHVLGGPAAVSDTVLTQLHTLTGVAPTRLAGGDRYDTAAAIVADAFPGTVDTVYLATGTNFPDALAGSASAAAKNAPVLLVTPDDIPPATATQLTRLLN